MNFVAIDFETANAKRSSICSVGVAVVRRWKIVKTESFLVKPIPNYYAAYNSLIHGLTEKDTRYAKTFKAQWKDLRKYMDKQVVVAHNASFESSALRSVLDAYSLPYPDLEYHCTLRLTQASLKLRRYSLDHVCRHLKIPLKHHHAESDAIACALVAIRLCKRYNAKSLKDLNRKLGFRPGRISEAGRLHQKVRKT